MKLVPVLTVLLLTGCVKDVRPLQPPVNLISLEKKITDNKPSKTVDKETCIINLYYNPNSSLLKTEYCLKGDLGVLTETRWSNLNRNNNFDQVCFSNQLVYKNESFIIYPKYCSKIRIPMDQFLFLERKKYL